MCGTCCVLRASLCFCCVLQCCQHLELGPGAVMAPGASASRGAAVGLVSQTGLTDLAPQPIPPRTPSLQKLKSKRPSEELPLQNQPSAPLGWMPPICNQPLVGGAMPQLGARR
uniref:Putative ORF3 protein n=1 Tax=Galago hepevirus TaxID=2796359 RepID=A0A8E0KJ08_9VIRU|nr:TPA: putative ORF3 protein [Galago hepevirus]